MSAARQFDGFRRQLQSAMPRAAQKEARPTRPQACAQDRLQLVQRCSLDANAAAQTGRSERNAGLLAASRPWLEPCQAVGGSYEIEQVGEPGDVLGPDREPGR